MDYERIRTFINSFSKDDTGLLGEIHSEALSSCVPIIRDETRDFLRTLIAIHKPGRILEVGTAVGYSAIVMAEAMEEYGDGGEHENAASDEGELGDAASDKEKFGHAASDEEKLGDAASDEEKFGDEASDEGELDDAASDVKMSANPGCEDAGDRDARIVSIEIDEKTAEIARTNIDKMGLSDKITVLCGDAAEILDDLSGYLCRKAGNDSEYVDDYTDKSVDKVDIQFDMVFIDAAKAQYQTYLDMVLKYVRKGSVIVCDNILMSGEILESHFHVEKRDRTIHDRMREFLRNLKNDDRFITSIVAVGDGMTISYVV